MSKRTGDIELVGGIIGTAGSGVGAGGTVSIAAGEGGSTGAGGTVSIDAGAGGTISGDGGVVTIDGGVGTIGSGGNVAITGGTTGTGTTAQVGGDVIITSGQSLTTAVAGGNSAGNVTIAGANYNNPGGPYNKGAGGAVYITAGWSYQTDGGNVAITAGDAYGGNGGEVVITGGVGDYSGDGFGGDIRLVGGEGQIVEGTNSYGGWIRHYGGDGDTGGGQIRIQGGRNRGTNSQVGDIVLQPGGNSNGSTDGSVIIRNTNASTPGVPTLEFEELQSNGGSFVGLRAPAALAASFTLTLPTTDSTGTQALVSDGSGTLSWATAGGGGISNVVEDTTPQLGGNLDLNAFDIITANAVSPSAIDLLAGAATGSNTGGNVNITAGASSTGEGGSISITAADGTSGGFPGTVNIEAGGAGSYSGGATAYVRGGAGSGVFAGGEVHLVGGNGGTTGKGADIEIIPGNGGSTSGNGGDILLNPGNATSGSAGAIRIVQQTAPSPTTDKLYNVGGALTWNGTDLTAGGGNSLSVTVQTGTTYTAVAWDAVMVDDDTAGSAVTITLPAGSTDDQIVVKKLGTTANVTVDGDSAETIDGAATFILTAQYASVSLIWNGTEWSII